MVSSLIPNPVIAYDRLFDALLPAAALIMTAGFYISIAHAATPKEFMMVLTKIISVVAVLVNLDGFANSAQNYVQKIIVEQLNADPAQTAEKYLDTLLQDRRQNTDQSLWSKFLNPSVTVLESIIAAVLFLISMLASVIFMLAYFFQKLLLQAAFGLAPLFMSFLCLRSTQAIGVRFLTGVGAILLWPLGWALASLFTDALIKFSIDQSLFVNTSPAGGLAYAFRNLLGGLLIAAWIILSTIAVPLIIMKAVVVGAVPRR